MESLRQTLAQAAHGGTSVGRWATLICSCQQSRCLWMARDDEGQRGSVPNAPRFLPSSNITARMHICIHTWNAATAVMRLCSGSPAVRAKGRQGVAIFEGELTLKTFPFVFPPHLSEQPRIPEGDGGDASLPIYWNNKAASCLINYLHDSYVI